MWCPPEYIHIHEVLDCCTQAALRLLPFDQENEYIDGDNYWSFDFEKSKKFRRKVFEGRLLELFLEVNNFKAFACSPAGELVRLSGNIVRPVRFNPRLRFEEPFARSPELLFVSVCTGRFDVAGTGYRMKSWADRDWDQRDKFEFWQEYAEDTFGLLDGWCVCYPRDEVSVSVEGMIANWERGLEISTSGDTGRPRKQEAVAEAYRSLFGNGHGKLTWKQVIRALEEAGTFTSLATLKRALDQKDADL